MNIFIFHRDLRIIDNTGLNQLAKHNEDIYLFFIFNKKQISKNSYFSPFAFNFMLKSLQLLSQKVTINFFEAKDELSVIKAIKDKKITRIYTNKDYTPFAFKRSNNLATFCQSNDIEYKEFQDYLLFHPKSYSAKNFTFFWKKAIMDIANLKFDFTTFKGNAKTYQNKYSISLDHFTTQYTNFPFQRENIIKAIKNVDKDYKVKRDLLTSNVATNISPAIKFGLLSIREVIFYSIFKKNIDNEYTRQIIWREFFYHSYLQSTVYRKSLQDSLLTRFQNFPFLHDQALFQKWCQGKTGFAIVDAAMHELNTTGYMHNRARMISASFLTKNLLIDWRWGEKYFASKLIDYDPIVNNCSWQWVAGTGYETNPFFRIFNPELQQLKFDKNKEYINKWLKNTNLEYEIIDYKTSRKVAIDTFKKFFAK